MAFDPTTATLEQSGFDPSSAQPEEGSLASKAVERANAFRSGVTNRFLPGVLSLPGQTIENVLNLSRAAAGTVAGAMGRTDLMPGLINSVPGNFNAAQRALGVLGLTVENPNPTDPANKAAEIAGGIVPSLVIPGTRLGQTTAATTGAIAGERIAGPQGEMIGALAPTAVSAAYGGLRGPALDAAKQRNLMRDETLAKARAEGYRFPPSETNPTLVNRFLEGWAGKLTTRQMASLENSEVTTNIVKRSLNLKKDEPITEGALESVRSEAGLVYQKVKNFGASNNLRFKTDAQFRGDLNKLDSAVARASKEYPEIVGNPGIDSLKSIAQKTDHEPAALVELIKDLRFQSKENYKSSSQQQRPAQAIALGDAQYKTANAVEEFLERMLSRSEQPKLMKEFRDARTAIARSYDVESALNDATGNVNARVLARLHDKNRPLGADLTTVAKTYKAFEKDLQAPEQIGSQPGISPLDVGVGAMSPAGIGAMILGRPIVRSAIMSRPYQALMGNPSYTPMIQGDSALGALLRGNLSVPLTQIENQEEQSVLNQLLGRPTSTLGLRG